VNLEPEDVSVTIEASSLLFVSVSLLSPHNRRQQDPVVLA